MRIDFDVYYLSKITDTRRRTWTSAIHVQSMTSVALIIEHIKEMLAAELNYEYPNLYIAAVTLTIQDP